MTKSSTSQAIAAKLKPRGIDISKFNQYSYARYAKRIINDVLHLKAGENLTVEAWEHELPFAKEVRFQARKLGANVVMFVEDDENYFRSFSEGHEKNLGRVGKHEWSLLENSDAYIFFPGPADALRQSKLEAKKRRESTAYNQEWYRRASKAGIRGVRVRTAYVTPSRAKIMGFDFPKWMANTLDAIDVDYGKIETLGRRLAILFKHGKNISVKNPSGTNLKLQLQGLSPHLYSGIMSEPLKYNIYSSVMSIPGSELDIVPKATSANGTVLFDRPIFVGSKKIEGLEWRFRNGKLQSYAAKQNVNLFRKQYAEAKGDKDKIGVLLLGLNPKLEYGFNQDFHVEGSVSIGIGSFGEGDRNRTEFQFFGTLSDASLKIDDTRVIENGKIIPI